MLDDAATAMVLLLFLSAAIERGVEVVISPFGDGVGLPLKRLVAVVLSLALASALAFGLGLDLVGPLLGSGSVGAAEGRALTAIALAGGSAPVHELLRLIEEAKKQAKEGAGGG